MRVTNNPANPSASTGNAALLSQPKQSRRVTWKSTMTRGQRTRKTIVGKAIVNTEKPIRHAKVIAKPSNPHSRPGHRNPAKTARDFLH